MSEKIDPLDDLTPEELEALNDTSIDGDEENEESEDDEETSTEEASTEEENTKVETPPTEEAKGNEDDDEETEEGNEQNGRQEAPLLNFEAPADAEAKLSDIASQKDALADEFDNGDITVREYQKKLDELNKQERSIERELDKAEIAREARATQERNAWMAEVERFLGENTVYQKPIANRALDEEVKRIANDASHPAHKEKNVGRAILEAAHKSISEEFGWTNAKPAKETKPAEAKIPKQPVPKTIKDIPQVEVPDTDGGKWAALDRLALKDPLAYERKLESMSKADRDAYLSAA